MLIYLRGTNGAGKSTIVRSVLSLFCAQPLTKPGRRRPLGYVCPGPTPLFIPGHYEIQNGGIDTIRSLSEVVDLVQEFHGKGMNVLCEGKNAQDKTLTRHFELLRIPLVFIWVHHPVEECIRSVRERGHRIAEKTIRQIDARCSSVTDDLIFRGFDCRILSRQDALATVRDLLNLP